MNATPNPPAVPTAGGAAQRFSRPAAHVDAPDLRLFVFALFFIFGGITSLNDVVIPKLKGLFTLTNGEVMLVQSAFFAAYFLFSLPAAVLVRRVGYIARGGDRLLLMAAGCLLFIPASASGIFAAFLAALFVLAAGITVIQVVANPLISMLGPPATAHSRLTFAQAFNSLGTTIFPYVGSVLILGSISKVDPARLSPRPPGRLSGPRKAISSCGSISGSRQRFSWSRSSFGRAAGVSRRFRTRTIRRSAIWGPCCAGRALRSVCFASFSTWAPRWRSAR